MKLLLTKFILLVIVLLSFTFSGKAQARKKADKDTEQWRYEIECSGEGVQGTYLIKVWSYSKKPHVAIDQAKKNAVHGIIFKGYPGGSGQQCQSQKPFARSANLENEQETFFKDFFADGGKYMRFVSLSTVGAVGAGDVMKVSKKEYKVGVVVAVNKAELRKYLEEEGVIKGLSTGF